MNFILNIPRNVLLSLIFLYQKVFSPDHGWLFRGKYPYGYCKHYPSCSEYTKQAVIKYGALKGVALGSWRIARCNPFSHGGFDPVK